MKRVIVIGDLKPEQSWCNTIKNQNRVYSAHGICPTINCGGQFRAKDSLL